MLGIPLISLGHLVGNALDLGHGWPPGEVGFVKFDARSSRQDAWSKVEIFARGPGR
jgi:hypothetical protein